MDRLSLTSTFKAAVAALCGLCLLACFSCTATTALAAQQVNIISAADSGYQQSLVQSIRESLRGSGIKIKTIDANTRRITVNGKQLIVSIGNESASLLDEKNITVTQLQILADIDPDKMPAQENISYLSMTQPLCRQFALIRSLDDEWQTVSLLLPEADADLIHRLETCANRYQLTLQVILINQYINVIDALNSTLSESDVLLALPDSSVYNAGTIKSILLTTYRHKVPIIGFSESFVRAGALAAMHSSTKQLGYQTAELIKKYYINQSIKQHYIYPDDFDVSINKDVAKSLGILIPDRKALIKKLKNKNNE
ncbi:MAG: ABC transporter substrate binding protein [Gammaproteobacteria bacterium]|nr:ABC transporter substrate binding protein [Gammaproteobacteria bacterium]